jgi:hypothetical protein
MLAWSNDLYGTSPPRILLSARQTALLKHVQHGSTGVVSVLHYTCVHHTLRQGFYSKPPRNRCLVKLLHVFSATLVCALSVFSYASTG